MSKKRYPRLGYRVKARKEDTRTVSLDEVGVETLETRESGEGVRGWKQRD